MKLKNLFFIKTCFATYLLLACIFLSTNTSAQEATNVERNTSTEFGPFLSNSSFPSSYSSGTEANNRFNVIADSDGISIKPIVSISGNKDSLIFFIWQEFTVPSAFTATQLSEDIPSIEGVKKGDIKVFKATSSSSDKIEYAVIRAIGNGDGLNFTNKGKSRTIGYWVNIPIQYKDNAGELKSGMLSFSFRGSESESKKIKFETYINDFVNSLSLKDGYNKISFDSFKLEHTKLKLRKELEADIAKSSGKEVKSDENAKVLSSISGTPVIRDIYMVDSDGNCYRFVDKTGLNKVTCPVHKTK